MDWRNRIGLYGAYFCGMAGIGFTLPYLPLYLGKEGLTDQGIGLICTVAAMVSLAQYPIGLWSDRVGRRKPFLLALLVALAVATCLLRGAHGTLWLGFLVMLFAENGICRATLESLAGAEAAHLARPGRVGAALGALRFWRPVSIVLMALLASVVAEQAGVGAALVPLMGIQALGVVAVLLIHEPPATPAGAEEKQPSAGTGGAGLGDRTLWVFAVSMVLFHVANSVPGVYLGLFLHRDLHAADRTLSYAFVVSMVAWMAIVWPAGRWGDRLGRKPLLVIGWLAMTVRLGLLTVAEAPWQILIIQILDGTAQALFAAAAAAWVTDRLADERRVGQAQVLVGAALVFGSAAGPLLAALVVENLGYRGTFALLAGVGAAATALVFVAVPETVRTSAGRPEADGVPAGSFSTLPQ